MRGGGFVRLQGGNNRQGSVGCEILETRTQKLLRRITPEYRAGSMDYMIGNTRVVRHICPACSNAEMERRLFVVTGNVVLVCSTCEEPFPKSRGEAWAKLHKTKAATAARLRDALSKPSDPGVVERMEKTERRHEAAYQAYLEHAKTQGEAED